MHLNMSYSDVRKMPIAYRKWFIKRLVKHVEQKNEQLKKNAPASQSSTRTKLSNNDINKFEEAISGALQRKFS